MESISANFMELIRKLEQAFEISSPERVILLILDVAIVAVIAYYIYRLVVQTRAGQIFKGFFIIVLIQGLARMLDLPILTFLSETFVIHGITLIIVVFQPELRSALEKIGRKNISLIWDFDDKLRDKQVVAEIVKAV